MTLSLAHRPARAPKNAVRWLVALTTLATGMGLVAAPAANAATPSKPTNVAVAGVSHSAITVTASRSTYATSYRLYVSTLRGKLAVTTVTSQRASASFSTPRVTISNLPYTTSVYYYRLEARNSSGVRYSDIFSVGLRPYTPENVTATGTQATGLSIKWTGGQAARYDIVQGTDSALTQNRAVYRSLSQARQFTPRLTAGTRYYFRVRGVNGSTASPYSALVSAVAPSRGQQVRVMTYNLMKSSRDGQIVNGEVVRPWSERQESAVALIRKYNPDVIGIQEGGDWGDAAQTVRMVDTLRSRLGSTYSLAYTEIPPRQRGWMRTGRYILYRNTAYAAVGTGGNWILNENGRRAAYHVLRNRTSGAKFLMVSAHLSSGSGLSYDLLRESETKSLMSQAGAYSRAMGAPVVYVGDFNSHEGRGHPVDGPARAMHAAGHTDGDEVAQWVTNRRFNSANQYYRTPLASSLQIDHIFTPPGVSVRGWAVSLTLVDGRFVGAIPSDHNPVVADVVYPY